MIHFKTPTVIQMEEIESGAAALTIILWYYKKFIPLEQVRIACGISQEGSLTSNILRAAKGYDLEAVELTMDVSQVKKEKGPFIVTWNIIHYVVIEKITEKWAYVNDPATGPRKIPLEIFEKNFSGTVIFLSPASGFKGGGRRRSFYQMIMRRLSGLRGALFYLILTGLFLLVPGIALPTLTQFFVDEILVRHLTSTAFVLLSGLALTTLTLGGLTALQGYFLNRLNGKLSIRLSSHFLWHILRLPVEYYAQRYGGEIAYRLQINDSVVVTLVGEIASAYISLLLVVVYGGLMFVYDPLIALIGILIGSFNVISLLMIYRSRTDANIRLQQDMGKRNGVSIGGLQNIESIKAAGAESDFFAKWAGHFTKTILSVQEIGKLDIFLTVLPPFTQFLAGAAVLTIGGLKVINGQMTLGMLLGLQTLMQTFLAPITRFVFLSQRIQNVNGGLNRLEDVLSNPVDPQLALYLPSGPQEKLKGELEIKNVTFGYNQLAHPFFSNLNLHIKPGQNIALIGPSGSGKSTLARLITGLYQHWDGEILFDGKPFSNITKATMTRSVAFVDQQIFLFGGTVRQNLTLWDEAVPENDMISACIDAHIHSDILLRDKGYESEVVQDGSNFSGGQRQRIEIARALALNPSLLVLDEATSALDTETELKVLKRIRQRGCSCLIIAHKLSAIRDCDEILVLENGKIVNRGTHNELKKTSTIYKEMLLAEGELYDEH